MQVFFFSANHLAAGLTGEVSNFKALNKFICGLIPHMLK